MAETDVSSPPHAASAVGDDAVLTPAQLAEAKEYGHRHLLAGLADMAVDVVYLTIAALVLAVPLDHWLAHYVASDTLRLIALFLIVLALHECLSFPLSLYSGHWLEQRYGLSRQSLGRWVSRHFKQLALGVALSVTLFVALFWVIRWTGPWWWLAAAAGFFVVSVLLSQLAPVLILPLFYKIERLDSPVLAERMERLAHGTGLSIEGVYRMQMSDETAKANAMLAGMGSTRRVIMGDTLLDGFTPDEIEVIFAHEIGHHVHRHLHKLIGLGLLFAIAGFWLCDRVLAAWVTRVSGELNYAELPVNAMPLVVLVLTLFFMGVGPLQNLISRHFERQCDRYALVRTGLREAYQSAFRKLARLNKDDPEPNRWEVLLFHSHPPVGERLAAADL
ncbi:MAG: M48 family metallopeptidase [Pirellulales bacterium]|nr:M48 family metallopeptidase [Pirellulales bacterium]